MKTLIQVLIFGFLSVSVCAQTPEQLAQQELDRRGLGDEEVRLRLQQRGIDVDAIDINNPSEVFKLEKTLKEVIDELEKEKISPSATGNSNLDVSKNISVEEGKILAKEGEEISKAIDDGATLQEAVSEELIDAQQTKLPEGNTYGQDLFRSQDLKLYRQSQDVKPPASYVLGVGDVISVSIWGYSEEDLLFEVNDNGYIKPTGIPRIYLKGIKLGEAKKLLESRFSNYYRFNSNQFEVSLNYGRTINVSIVGEVYNYGSFNIPAINTAFNAIVAAGGPNDIGSVRNIFLKRSGESDKNIDVYKYLKDPSFASDFYIEEGDIIFIPVREKVVSISGGVKRPNKYELKENETLIDLIDFAGGLNANANVKNVKVTRYAGDERKVLDLNLEELLESGDAFIMESGDVVSINSIAGDSKNYVTLNGALDIPGNYALVKGDKVSDVLNKVKLNDNALLEFSYLKRKNYDGTTSYMRLSLFSILNEVNSSDNIELQNGDQIVIYNQSQFIDSFTFEVQGSVRQPNTFSYDQSKSIKVYDAILLAGGLQEYATDFAYLQSPDPKDPGKLVYRRLDMAAIMKDPSVDDNVVMAPNSKVIVYSKKAYLDTELITIQGFVKRQGVFKYDPSLGIRDIIEMSGGLKFNASRNRVDVYRLDISDTNSTKTLAAQIELDENWEPKNASFKLMPNDLIIVRNAAGYEPIKTVTIKGEVSYPGEYALVGDNEKFSSIIERAGGLTEEAFVEGMYVYRPEDGTGFVTIDGNMALKSNSKQNLILKDRDEIIIPKKNSLVKIMGETKLRQDFAGGVLNTNGRVITVPYDKDKDAMWYINEYAGGVDSDGDKSKIAVRYANGRQETVSRKLLIFRDYPDVRPGSTILVPSKPAEKTSQNREPIDWSSVLQNSVTQATAILTLILLANRID